MAVLNDFVILGQSADGKGTFGFNEAQLVSAKQAVDEMGTPAIAMQFSNGLTIEITREKYGVKAYEMLRSKYFDSARVL